MSCITTSKRRKAFEIMKGARIPKLLTYKKIKQFIDSRWNTKFVICLNCMRIWMTVRMSVRHIKNSMIFYLS